MFGKKFVAQCDTHGYEWMTWPSIVMSRILTVLSCLWAKNKVGSTLKMDKLYISKCLQHGSSSVWGGINTNNSIQFHVHSSHSGQNSVNPRIEVHGTKNSMHTHSTAWGWGVGLGLSNRQTFMKHCWITYYLMNWILTIQFSSLFAFDNDIWSFCLSSRLKNKGQTLNIDHISCHQGRRHVYIWLCLKSH